MSSTNQQAELKVSGMSCSGCANAVEQALTRLDGIEKASANHENDSASVEYDADKVTPADFKEAIESASYTFDGIKHKPV